MTKVEWLCWRPEHGETVDNAKRVHERDVQAAANAYVHANFARWDYPKHTVVSVRHAEGAFTQVVDVEAIPEPTFEATIRKVRT